MVSPDRKLRNAGWVIHDRPKGKEAIWRFYVHGKVGFEATQTEALRLLAEAENKQKGKH